jgi:hypothetical protein
VVSRLRRLAAPLAFLALSAACSQVLDIQDAWVDPSLGGSSGSSNSNAGSLSNAGEKNSGGTGPVAGGHNHSGGSTSPAGGNAGSLSNAGKDGVTAGAAGAETPVETSPCETYCDSVIKNCKGKYEQYRTFDQCIAVCKLLPAGNPGDENVNSVECRIRQARFAESEAFLYCKSAGPLGAGKCGSNCVSYCSLMDGACTKASTDGNTELSYFESTQECLSACGAMPPDPTGPTQYSSSATVEPSTLIGDNVYCRTYHVTAGIEQESQNEHCPHAMGGDPCIPQ